MITVFRTIYFQTILNYTPLQTGLIMFVSSLPMLVAAPIAGYLSDRITPKLPIAMGYLLLILSNFWLAFFNTPSFGSLSVALLAFGFGIPFIFTPSYSHAVASVPAGKSGTAVGMITTLRMTGGAMGLALIHLFITTIQQRHAQEGQRLAEIASFSAVHFALAFLLIITFAIVFIVHSRKSTHHLPEASAEGWD
jgi:MFS family permease